MAEKEKKQAAPQAEKPGAAPKIESIAPDGFRELRPGKQLVGPKVWSSAQFTLIDGKWHREKVKNSLVPDKVALMLCPKDKEGKFDEKIFNDWVGKTFL